MNNYQSFLEVFGGLTIGTAVLWLGAIFFLGNFILKYIPKLTKWYDGRKADREVLDHYQEEMRGIYQTLQNNNESMNNTFNELINSINHICHAQIESLNDRIRQKCRYYVSLGYIPEDELEDFQRMMKTYQDIGGNHGLELKFNKTMELPIKIKD